MIFSLALAAAGLGLVAATSNLLAAFLALLTLVSYNVVYTPMKRRSQLATLVGAVPGALPPMIGWVAARGALTPEAWALFAIVFVWQIPHFMAIAWLYRDDFGRAGFPLLPVVEPDGRSTARQAVLFSLLCWCPQPRPVFPSDERARSMRVGAVVGQPRAAGSRRLVRAASGPTSARGCCSSGRSRICPSSGCC